MSTRAGRMLLVLAASTGVAIFGATPPALVNYQGVLRSSSDAPLSGSYDMTLRFYSAVSGGDEILVDQHTTLVGAPVTVSGGLFNVGLGGGSVLDGAGPGTYASLADVFRDYGTVYLDVQIGTETLAPRTRVVGSAYALNASNLGGRAPAEYIDTSATAQTKAGRLTANSSGIFDAAVSGVGTGLAGRFTNTAWGSSVTLAERNTAGHFVSGESSVYLAYSGNYGVYAQSFGDGVVGQGGVVGGHFCNIPTGFCAPGVDSQAYLGYGDYGLQAQGRTIGGYFKTNTNVSDVYLANGDYGLQSKGRTIGGYSSNTANGTDGAMAYGDWGMFANGNAIAGHFYSNSSAISANISSGPYTIQGNGAKAFVQNHPGEKDRVIVYNALEGDETGTYTRGSARLIDGEARVPLDPTFAWVTNPDIGLTVQLTPVGGFADLYVATKSTRELVVRSRDPQASGAAFDYIVLGLRIGFEELSIVEEKAFEAYIPSMASVRARYSAHPELRQFNALARFTGMRETPDQALDLTASQTLHALVGEYDPAIHGSLKQSPLGLPVHEVTADPTSAPAEVAPDANRPPSPAAKNSSLPDAPLYPPGTTVVGVAETVEAGDLVATDPAQPAAFVRSRSWADAGVVGIVAGEPGQRFTSHAPLALSGSIVHCWVDATSAPIEVNDLLVASALPGVATRAGETPRPGTIVGKALEALTSGIGTIRVLAMSR